MTFNRKINWQGSSKTTVHLSRHHHDRSIRGPRQLTAGHNDHLDSTFNSFHKYHIFEAERIGYQNVNVGALYALKWGCLKLIKRNGVYLCDVF